MTVTRSRCTMTLGSQTRKEATEPTGSLVHPKNTLKIGNWNVRTLYRTGNLAQTAREISNSKRDEQERNIHYGYKRNTLSGQGKLQIVEGETNIYSGREDNIHRAGVGILMSQDAAGALIEWIPVSERIIQTRFHSRHIKLTVIHVYAQPRMQMMRPKMSSMQGYRRCWIRETNTICWLSPETCMRRWERKTPTMNE